MPNPLTTKRNPYYNEPKNSSIYTPAGVSQFIYDLIIDNIKNYNIILDPAVGGGSLLKPFTENKNFKTIGIDIYNDPNRIKIDYFYNSNFLRTKNKFINEKTLVIMNPPFNNEGCKKVTLGETKNCKECYFKLFCMKNYLHETKQGKALIPELFLKQVWKLYGIYNPCVCMTPMGLLKNQRKHSKRWRIMRDEFPEISSIISLPLDIYPNVEFHNEVLIFNIPNLKPHYFLPEKYLY